MSCERRTSKEVVRAAVDLPVGIPWLTSFYLYLTTGCNLHCQHCWIVPDGNRDQPYGQAIDLDALQSALAEAKPMGLVNIKLTGGEPMLHPRFQDILAMIKREEFQADMETNGTLITADAARFIKDHSSIRFVSVSIDSPDREFHDVFRGQSGAWEAAVAGINHLLECGIAPQVIMSVSRDNLHMVDDLIRLAIRLRAGSVKFNPVNSMGRGMEMNRRGRTLDFDEIMALKHRVIHDLQPKVPLPLIILLPPALMTVGELLATAMPGGTCSVLNTMGILGSGEYALCGIGQQYPEMCYGSMGKDSLREIWLTHPAILRLRNGLTDALPDVCNDCVHGPRCITHCAAMNYIDFGTPIHASRYCVEALRKGRFPANRKKRYETGMHPLS
ncbi:radical SAM protein [bacterium]|nr:radical SAM protein [candidate division CSSED10-310 bacterium]